MVDGSGAAALDVMPLTTGRDDALTVRTEVLPDHLLDQVSPLGAAVAIEFVELGTASPATPPPPEEATAGTPAEEPTPTEEPATGEPAATEEPATTAEPSADEPPAEEPAPTEAPAPTPDAPAEDPPPAEEVPATEQPPAEAPAVEAPVSTEEAPSVAAPEAAAGGESSSLGQETAAAGVSVRGVRVTPAEAYEVSFDLRDVSIPDNGSAWERLRLVWLSDCHVSSDGERILCGDSQPLETQIDAAGS